MSKEGRISNQTKRLSSDENTICHQFYAKNMYHVLQINIIFQNEHISMGVRQCAGGIYCMKCTEPLDSLHSQKFFLENPAH